ncbi:MAG: helix-turn-helix transcriptional regulator [Muribaculaceae bacterium]|nr:helix-turn-helix transcriptional regulator [Muribaculaceae bacterium]
MSNRKKKLTEREHQVLALLSRGCTSNEISAQLFISSNTVEYHRKQLLRKTNSRNVADLIGNAYRQGLLRIDE